MTLSANSITATAEELSAEALRACINSDAEVQALKAELGGYKEAQQHILEAEDGYIKKITELETMAKNGRQIDDLQEQRLAIKNEYITQLKEVLAEANKRIASERKWMAVERVGTILFFIALKVASGGIL